MRALTCRCARASRCSGWGPRRAWPGWCLEQRGRPSAPSRRGSRRHSSAGCARAQHTPARVGGRAGGRQVRVRGVVSVCTRCCAVGGRPWAQARAARSKLCCPCTMAYCSDGASALACNGRRQAAQGTSDTLQPSCACCCDQLCCQLPALSLTITGGQELLPQGRCGRRLLPVRSAAGAGSGTGSSHPGESWQRLSSGGPTFLSSCTYSLLPSSSSDSTPGTKSRRMFCARRGAGRAGQQRAGSGKLRRAGGPGWDQGLHGWQVIEQPRPLPKAAQLLRRRERLVPKRKAYNGREQVVEHISA